MAWHLPPLNPLRAFEAAARHGSISRAADELAVTQAAVSRQVRVLELSLNARLFERKHRRVELTPAGANYYAIATRLFAELEAATDAVTGRRGRRPLRICGYNTFNMRWLIPRLTDFQARYPDVQVTLSSFARADEGDLSGHDGIIRTGNGHFKDAEAMLLAPIRLSPVCSPELAAVLRTPSDLHAHTLLHSANRLFAWGRWLAVAGVDGIDPESGQVFDNGVLCYQAALEGMGVAMAEEILVADDIRRGRLVGPFDLQTEEDFSYYFVRARASQGPAVKAFGEWLKRQVSVT